MDRAGPLDRRQRGRPEAGDLSLCIRCAAILIYDERLRLQPASLDIVGSFERDEPKAFATMQAARRAILMISLKSAMPGKPS